MLKSLEIELWPEFDRSETLVIYRAELASTVTLPAEVTFRLPATVESMFVVAVEQEGVLVEVNRDAFKLERADDAMLLTFSTPVPRVQFEYYDASILTKQGAERQLKFEVVASYPTEKATFQVQQPFQAEKFALTPLASSTFTGTDGLTYAMVETAGLAQGETFSLTANYSRATDVLSAQNLAGPTAEHAADLPTAAESPVAAQSPANENLTLGYILIGVGVTLLLGVAVYWVRSKKAAPAKVRSAIRRPKRTARPVEASAPATSPPVSPPRNFCYRCGVALRDDANFCHSCGAERRRE